MCYQELPFGYPDCIFDEKQEGDFGVSVEQVCNKDKIEPIEDGDKDVDDEHDNET